MLFKPLQKRKLKWLRPVFILQVLVIQFISRCTAFGSSFSSYVYLYCIGRYVCKKIIDLQYTCLFSIVTVMHQSLLALGCWLSVSYAAVLSIVIFMQPIYNWFYIKNKLLDFIWKLNAVTIAAQILTVPVSIYHFHQFPNYFLLTNFFAVHYQA